MGRQYCYRCSPRSHLRGRGSILAFATIEVLRLSGIRHEELLELSHHSITEYRLPSTGELVPLLQIAPSKTDTERLILVSPELAEVLSAVVQRSRQPNGSIPLVAAYDTQEKLWNPPMPLLFQRGNRKRTPSDPTEFRPQAPHQCAHRGSSHRCQWRSVDVSAPTTSGEYSSPTRS